jgi:hypothetical protein
MIKRELRLPIFSIVLLSFGGWLLHGRVHPVSFDPANPSNPAFLVPYLSGLLSIIVVPMLLNYRATFIVGYLVNGLSVVVGTIGMTMLTLAHLPSPVTFVSIFTGTMLADILLLFPKLFLGQMVLLHYHPKGMGRLFNAFWWTRHVVYLSVIFALGHLIWR